MKLHEYSEAIANAFVVVDENGNETGEVVDGETGEIFDSSYLDSLQMGFDKKLRDIILYRKELMADVDQIDKQAKMLRELKRNKAYRIDSLAKYIDMVLQGKKWEAEDLTCKVSYRLSKDVVAIDSLQEIPKEYFKIPIREDNLNKTAIKEALKAGEKITGVHLQDKNNIQIK